LLSSLAHQEASKEPAYLSINKSQTRQKNQISITKLRRNQYENDGPLAPLSSHHTKQSTMAAPALSSPNQATTTTMDTSTTNNKPNAVTTDVTATTSPPCYLSTKHSVQYTLAKSKLSSGELDECLLIVERQLVEVKSSLMSSSIKDADSAEDKDGDATDSKDNNGGDDKDLELHEALCPLYYLYGTTLLYLVEENESMMNAAAAGGKVS
jgi:hypothetical protein